MRFVDSQNKTQLTNDDRPLLRAAKAHCLSAASSVFMTKTLRKRVTVLTKIDRTPDKTENIDLFLLPPKHDLIS